MTHTHTAHPARSALPAFPLILAAARADTGPCRCGRVARVVIHDDGGRRVLCHQCLTACVRRHRLKITPLP
jgi:hypothetical protein